MELTYKITLVIHVLCGFLSLLCGGVAVGAKKGGIWHRRSGSIFFFSMLGVCITSVYISILKSKPFLLHIGLFSFYLDYFGYMALRNRSLRPRVADWLVLLLGITNSALMIWSKNTVLVVFGLISLYAIAQNIRMSIKALTQAPLSKLAWLRRHIGMMMGAFIASATAFLVVNIDALPLGNFPSWFGWLLPTFVLVPLIFYYSRKYTAGKKTDRRNGIA